MTNVWDQLITGTGSFAQGTYVSGYGFSTAERQSINSATALRLLPGLAG